MEEPCLTCDKYSDEKECCCKEYDKYLAYTLKANADEDFTLVVSSTKGKCVCK